MRILTLHSVVLPKRGDRDRDDRYSFNDSMIISLCNSINIA